MNPSQIINDLQSRLQLPHAIQVSCKVDNFGGNKQIKTSFEVYISQQLDCPSVHAQALNLEDAFAQACEHIAKNFQSQLDSFRCTPIPDPFPVFLSCSSPEQDETAVDDIEPLETDNDIPF